MIRPRLRHLLLAAALTGACGGALAQSSNGDVPLGPAPVQASLPDLGSGANAMLTRADEYQIGRMMVSNLRSQNAILEDPEVADYIQTLGLRIAAVAQDGQQQFQYFPVRDSSINAFALPGGFIGVNTGLILLTSTESELAAVMSHETGHIMQRHIARAVQAQAHSGLATMATMLGAVLIGAVTGNASALPGIIAMGQGAAMQQQINFTRMEETEADSVGIGFLAAAGFDPNAMAGFFSTMSRERGVAGDDIPPLLLDHPVDTVRIARARARVGALTGYQRRPDSESYPYIRERVRVVTANSDADQRHYYEHMMANDPGNDALKYGAALAEIRWGDPTKAVYLLRPLAENKPQLPLLQSALGDAWSAAGEGAQGLETFEQALAVNPRNVPLSVHYAEALLKQGDAKKAHNLLLDLFNNVPPTPDQIRLIALAASSAGDTGDAYYYMAELHIASGDLMLATTQLDLALATPGLTDVQRKRFAARREEIRGYLREQRGDRSSRPGPTG